MVTFSKFVYLVPSPSYDAEHLAAAIMVFYALFDILVSDPSAAFTARIVYHLNNWFGMKHRKSIVDVYTSSGVERPNNSILRLALGIVFYEHIKHK